MATATQFGSRKFWELFSCSAHFLHFFARKIFNALTAFLGSLLAKKGERCKKQTVHRVGHHRVHLTDSASHRRMKKFGATRSPSWARLGRVMGWNDPTFSSLARPKGFSGSF